MEHNDSDTHAPTLNHRIIDAFFLMNSHDKIDVIPATAKASYFSSIPDRCGMCGGNQLRLRYRSTIPDCASSIIGIDPYSVHYGIWKCEKCELMFAHPIPVPADIASLYATGVSTGARESDGTNIAEGEIQGMKRTMDGYLDCFLDYVNERGTILDVGCDVGLLLESAGRANFKSLRGNEPNPIAAKQASQILGSCISESYYEAMPVDLDSCDAISMIHVLDHLPDPLLVLRKAYRELKRGGILFAVVHDANCLLARLTGEKFPPLNLYHFQYFTRHTLARCASEAGLDPIAVVPTHNHYSLAYLVEKAPLPIPQFAIKLLKNYNNLASRIFKVRLGNIGIIARKP